MLRFTRPRSSQVLAVAAAAAVVGAITTGIAVAAPASTSYKACANGAHRLALQNAAGHCPRRFRKVTLGAQGPAGPSGVVSMTQYSPVSATEVLGSNWGFLGAPPTETFANRQTAAEVIGTVDEASYDGVAIAEQIGVCYEPAGGSTVTAVSQLTPAFAAPKLSYFAQTVSGAIGSLTPGRYIVGLCARFQDHVANGDATVTIVMAQTSSGVSHLAPPATKHQGSSQ